MTVPLKSRKGTPPRRRFAVQWTIWPMNGGPLPESVMRKIDDAVQKVVDDSKVRLATHCHKEDYV